MRILPSLAIFALIVLSANVNDSGGVAAVDALMLLTIPVAATILSRTSFQDDRLVRVTVALATVIWAYSIVGLASVIFGSGSAVTFGRDVYSLLFLLIPLVIMNQFQLKAWPWLFRLVALTGSVLSISVFFDPSIRPGGLMGNPNLASSWLGVAILLLIVSKAWKSTWICLPAIGVMTSAIIQCQSYSSLLGLSAAIAYLIFVGNNRTLVRILLGPLLVAAAIGWQYLLSILPGPDRLETSSGSREQIWGIAIDLWWQNPLGIGYGNFAAERHATGGVETHNDLLTALVEMGVIGALVWAAVIWVAWRRGGRAAHAMLFFVVINSFFHNVINFRHMWLFVALCIVYDLCSTGIETEFHRADPNVPSRDRPPRTASLAV